MLSIVTGSDSTGLDPVDDGLVTPTLRKGLETAAPQLLNKFDSIRRDKEHQLNQIEADWAKGKATFLSDLSQSPELSIGTSSGSSEHSRATNDSSISSQSGPRPPQATTQARQRVALSTSTTSNPASPHTKPQPQATTKAKTRIAPSTSTASHPASLHSNQRAQTTTQAKSRVPLSTSTTSDPVLTQSKEQPQATTQAKVRVPLSTSTTSNQVSPRANQQSTANNQAGQRVAHPSAASTTANSDSTSSTTSSAAARKAITSREAVLSMQIQIRLIPAVKLLTAQVTTPVTRAQAKAQAHAALNYAIENNASPPLAARCTFYIAHATYIPADDTTTQDAVNWFERATEAAEADYPEGQWAQEWLNRYESLNMDSRPSTSSSWIASISNNVWNKVFSRNSSLEESDPAPALKPRPGFFGRLYSNDKTRPSKLGFGRIPSFTTWNSGDSQSPGSAKEASPIAPSSAKEAIPKTPSFSRAISKTRDYYGLQWSPGHPYGKGKILGDQEFELVLSPESDLSPIPWPIPEEISEEEQQRMQRQADVHAGLIDPSALSFRSRQLFGRDQGQPRWRTILHNLDYYVPPVKQLRVVNQTASLSSTKSSPNSPTAGRTTTTKPSSKHSAFSWAPGNLSLSLFPPPQSDKVSQHSRAQSVSLPYSPGPVATIAPVRTRSYAASEGAKSSEGSFPRKNKKRLSISHAIIRATGLDVQRTRDEAARMEEGESPAFGPRREEAGLYRRFVGRSDSGVGIGGGGEGVVGDMMMEEEGEEEKEGVRFRGFSGEWGVSRDRALDDDETY